MPVDSINFKGRVNPFSIKAITADSTRWVLGEKALGKKTCLIAESSGKGEKSKAFVILNALIHGTTAAWDLVLTLQDQVDARTPS